MPSLLVRRPALQPGLCPRCRGTLAVVWRTPRQVLRACSLCGYACAGLRRLERLDQQAQQRERAAYRRQRHGGF